MSLRSTASLSITAAIRIAAAVALLAGAALPAWSDEFHDKVDEALALASAQQTVQRLEQEAYRGNLVAAYQLGLLHREGKGVPKDEGEAYERFEEAGAPNWIRARYKLGLAAAQYEAGVMSRDGVGVAVDPEEAAEWFERAAEQGHGDAQLALAQMYLRGTGVERDPERAYFWASLARRASDELDEPATAIRKEAVGHLAPAEIKTAQRAIRTWTADDR